MLHAAPGDTLHRPLVRRGAQRDSRCTPRPDFRARSPRDANRRCEVDLKFEVTPNDNTLAPAKTRSPFLKIGYAWQPG